MLRDRSAPVDLFVLLPTLVVPFEPVLARLHALLDDDVLVQAVKADLARRRPHAEDRPPLHAGGGDPALLDRAPAV